MDTSKAHEVALGLMRDQHMPGGEVGIGYRLELVGLRPSQYVQVVEAVGSHEGRVTGHRIMPFKFWMQSVAVACGIEASREDMELVEIALRPQLSREMLDG